MVAGALMDRYRRVNELLAMLDASPRPVGTKRLLEELECSRYTLYRAVQEASGLVGAPIVYDDAAKGWRMDAREKPFKLPRVWFSPTDLFILMTLCETIGKLTPGLLRAELDPFKAALDKVLGDKELGASSLLERIKFIPIEERNAPPDILRACAEALLRRRRLEIAYEGRQRPGLKSRVVSPQHLVHYRDAWYLDAWCHERKALRTFSVDRIRSASVLKETARLIPESELEKHFSESYGIFSGKPTKRAVLRFTADRARWVAGEKWHPKQSSRFLKDGRFELSIPYRDDRELILDILRHGEHVEVVRPASLRRAVAGALRDALAQYRRPKKR